MLDRKVVDVTFRAGVDESTDKFSLGTGQFLVAENVRFSHDGSVQKRSGHTQAFAASGGVQIAAGEGRLVANGSELLLLDGRNVTSYSPGAGARLVCPAPRHVALTSSLASPTSLALQPNCTVYVNGATKYLLVVWTQQASYFSSVGGYVYAKLYDYDTLQPLATTGLTVQDRLNSGSSQYICPQAIVTGSYIVVAYADSATNNIYYRKLNAGTLVWGAETTLSNTNAILGGIAGSFAIAPTAGSSSSDFVFAHQVSGGTTARVGKWSAQTDALVASVTLADTGVNAPTGYGLCATSGEYCYVTYGYDAADGNGCRFKLSRINYTSFAAEDAGFPISVWTPGAFSSFTNANLAYCFVSGVVRGANATSVVCAWTGEQGDPNPTGTSPWVNTWFTRAAAVSGTTVGNQVTSVGYTKLLSAPFLSGSRYYAVAQRDTGEWYNETWGTVKTGTGYGGYNGYNRGSCVVLDLRVADESALHMPEDVVIFPDLLAATDGTPTFRPTVQLVSPNNMALVVGTLEAGQQRKSIKLAKLLSGPAADPYRYHPATDGTGVYLSGGLVCTYDRSGVYPVNFTVSPTWCRVGESSNAGGSGWSITSRYYYQVVWERIDGYGRVSRSAPDFGIKKGSGATLGQGTLAQAWVTPSAATSQVRVIWPNVVDGWDRFATTNGTAIGRTRVAMYTAVDDTNTLKLLSANGAVAVGFSGQQTSTSYSPADLDATPPYTLGGVVGNSQPPCLLSLVAWSGRLVGIDSTKRSLWFSKTLLTGEVAQFAPDFTISCPFDAEALGVLDDKLIVFGADRIGAVAGEGPNDAGAGSAFPDVALVCVDKGIRDTRSVVQVPGGLMFRGQSGICLLDRALNVSFVGQAVKDTLASYPVVTSAIVHPTETVVLFSCNNTAGTAGRRLVYDYRLGRWSVDIFASGAAILSQAVVGTSVYVLTNYYLGFNSAQVWVEDPTVNTDNGTWVTLRVKTAPVRLAGIQGYQRVWRYKILGERQSDHDLLVKVYTDDRTTPDSTHTFTHAVTSLTPPMLAERRAKRQLCRALSVEISDATPTAGGTAGIGAGPILSAVSLEVGVAQGTMRDPASRRA